MKSWESVVVSAIPARAEPIRLGGTGVGGGGGGAWGGGGGGPPGVWGGGGGGPVATWGLEDVGQGGSGVLEQAASRAVHARADHRSRPCGSSGSGRWLEGMAGGVSSVMAWP